MRDFILRAQRGRIQQLAAICCILFFAPLLGILALALPEQRWLAWIAAAPAVAAVLTILYWVHITQKLLVCPQCGKGLSGLMTRSSDPITRSSLFIVIPPVKELRELLGICPFCQTCTDIEDKGAH